jgi:hypothetical protein
MSACKNIGGRRHPAGRVWHPAKRSSRQALNRCYVICLLGTALVTPVAAEKPARQQGGSRQPVQTSTASEVPAHAFDVILGRPTGTSITVSVLCYSDAEACIRYGIQPGKLALKTPARLFKKGEPATIELSGLKPDTCYYYQLEWAQTKSGEASFHTARPPGGTFTFTVTADSHLDDRTVPALYQQTLTNALADKPDFHIDLGDTFMTEKHANREAAAKQYLAQRYYLSPLCQSVPLFLALGNHDGENPSGRGNDAESTSLWAKAMRKRYFPNPEPNSFYSGDTTAHPDAGLLEDYCAWQWGDALFIVLDPYWHTRKPRGKGDSWSHTLGDDQYQWLKRTLENSRAKFKLVFIHQLLGGGGDACRGGAESAPLYEWGGQSADGSGDFKQNRPGWPLPIHSLLVQNKVSIVFHGHDHFYAKQDLDGMIYQEVPQPGTPANGSAPRSAAEYGYLDGTILGGPGHLRVGISPQQITVDCLRSAVLPQDGTKVTNRQVAHAYTVPSR